MATCFRQPAESWARMGAIDSPYYARLGEVAVSPQLDGQCMADQDEAQSEYV